MTVEVMIDDYSFVARRLCPRRRQDLIARHVEAFDRSSANSSASDNAEGRSRTTPAAEAVKTKARKFIPARFMPFTYQLRCFRVRECL